MRDVSFVCWESSNGKMEKKYDISITQSVTEWKEIDDGQIIFHTNSLHCTMFGMMMKIFFFNFTDDDLTPFQSSSTHRTTF
jgi:hypothetical protein